MFSRSTTYFLKKWIIRLANFLVGAVNVLINANAAVALAVKLVFQSLGYLVGYMLLPLILYQFLGWIPSLVGLAINLLSTKTLIWWMAYDPDFERPEYFGWFETPKRSSS